MDELRNFRKARRAEAKKIAASVAKEFRVPVETSYRPLTGTCVACIDATLDDVDSFKAQVAASNALVSRGYKMGECQTAREFPTGTRFFFYFNV